MSETLQVQMSKILKEYSEEVRQVADDAIKNVANETVQRLKATSPKKRIKGGTYAAGWALKSVSGSGNIRAITVYNRRAPGLTHLLENGHESYNQNGGSYSYVSGRPHIKPVEEWANKELEIEVKRRLE